MNPALSWIIGIASSVLAGILLQYFYIPFRIAEAIGKYEERARNDTIRFRNLRQDLQEAYEAISANRDMHKEEIAELRDRFNEFRVKVAAKTGINGR